MKPIMMAAYHHAVIDELAALPWVANADEYPEQRTQITTPAVFLDVSTWRAVENCSGQPVVELECNLYVVCDKSGQDEAIPKPAIYARALAADLSQWVDQHSFGLEGVKPAVFTEAARDAFDPDLAEYIVFRVSYSQEIAIGDNPQDSSGAPLKDIWLGRAPKIGRAHVDDYVHIYHEREDE